MRECEELIKSVHQRAFKTEPRNWLTSGDLICHTCEACKKLKVMTAESLQDKKYSLVILLSSD